MLPEANILRREWLRYCAERPSYFDFKVASWGTASTLSEYADYSVGTVWGVKELVIISSTAYEAEHGCLGPISEHPQQQGLRQYATAPPPGLAAQDACGVTADVEPVDAAGDDRLLLRQLAMIRNPFTAPECLSSDRCETGLLGP